MQQLFWQILFYFLRPEIHFPSSSPNVDFYLVSLTLTCCCDPKGLKYPGLPFSDVPGKIFSLDLQDPRVKPVELRMPRNFDLESFNPHGISVYEEQSGAWAKLTLWLTCTRGNTENLSDVHHSSLFEPHCWSFSPAVLQRKPKLFADLGYHLIIKMMSSFSHLTTEYDGMYFS